jgi:hypothetical protein
MKSLKSMHVRGSSRK